MNSLFGMIAITIGSTIMTIYLCISVLYDHGYFKRKKKNTSEPPQK